MYANPIQVCWTPNIRSASVTKEKEYGRLSCLVWLQTLSQILVLWLFVAFWDFVCQLFLFMLSAIFIILTFLQPLLVSHILNDCYNIYVKELNLVPGSNLLASRCVPSGFTAPCFTCGSRLFYYPPVLYLPAGKSLPSRFPEGGDFAPLGPQDCPRASPSGYLAVLGGCISQYIPPLGSVRIQYDVNIATRKLLLFGNFSRNIETFANFLRFLEPMQRWLLRVFLVCRELPNLPSTASSLSRNFQWQKDLQHSVAIKMMNMVVKVFERK